MPSSLNSDSVCYQRLGAGDHELPSVCHSLLRQLCGFAAKGNKYQQLWYCSQTTVQHKTGAILTALKGRLINDLITD